MFLLYAVKNKATLNSWHLGDTHSDKTQLN